MTHSETSHRRGFVIAPQHLLNLNRAMHSKHSTTLPKTRHSRSGQLASHHLPLLLLVLSLAHPCSSVPVSPPPPTAITTEGEAPLFEGDELLQAPAAQWRSILVRMTAQNPCGSAANYELCRECGRSTGDGNAFYLCCVNEDGVRQFCHDFLNHTIESVT